MTYPPQPPGGGPYGPQQPPYGQQPGPPGGQPGPFGPPPQQPDPYGQQPPQQDPYGQQQPGPYGQPQPDPYGPSTPYQGLGGYPGGPPPPPPKKNTTMVVVVVVVALLVLGGAGAAIYFLTKDDKSNSAGSTPQTTAPKATDDRPSETKAKESSNTPESVQQAYIDAYESKSFSTVVDSACQAYKEKFGTDTAELEQQLAPYDITATAAGDPKVTGTSATARIDLELTKGAETKTPKIEIKIVKEGGQWRFCGEGEAK
jgi:hypothetical protein